MTKCTTPRHASQVSAAIGNTTSWCSSLNAMVMTRKRSPLIGTVSAMPLQHAASHHPLGIATLFSAKVNAPSAV